MSNDPFSQTATGAAAAASGAVGALAMRTAGWRMDWPGPRALLRRLATSRAFEGLYWRYRARAPLGFTDKVLHKMAYDRRRILTRFADKIAVRDIVSDRVGSALLTHLYAVAGRAEELDWSAVPEEFALKVNHGSGGVILVSRAAPAGARLPAEPSGIGWTRFHVRPEHADRRRITALAAHWLALDYSRLPGRVPEWAYRGIRRRVFVEELLVDDSGAIPADYKFFVFDGRCRFVQVDSTRAADHRRDVFSPEWTRLPVTMMHPAADSPPPRPPTLAAMLRIAQELGRGIDFVRVDLYSLADRIVFGELTNYPEGGHFSISPHSFDEEWGTLWRLPRPLDRWRPSAIARRADAPRRPDRA